VQRLELFAAELNRRQLRDRKAALTSLRLAIRVSSGRGSVAVDINPFQNPYRHGDLVLPEKASAYLDREWVRPGMIRPGDVVTSAFAEIRWGWDGAWRSPVDYTHFSGDGLVKSTRHWWPLRRPAGSRIIPPPSTAPSSRRTPWSHAGIAGSS
jgi:hypothetical protein